MEGDDNPGQGARDAAAVLPLIAGILLLPPIILIFAIPVLIYGVPLILVYMFGAWAVVIGASFLIARRLARPDRNAPGNRTASR